MWNAKMDAGQAGMSACKTSKSHSKKKNHLKQFTHTFLPQIRLLIKAVSRYARSQVDVLGHSMGSPLARKVSCCQHFKSHQTQFFCRQSRVANAWTLENGWALR
jgi:hypothetical protein